MTSAKTLEPVRYTITVPVSQERAFARFTEEIASWWPVGNTFTRSAEELETIRIETRPGGRWYERSADGEELSWGRVLAFEPPERLVLTWQITHTGAPEPDPEKASEIEIRFFPTGPQTTRIELTHRHFERHGPDGGPVWRAGMQSEQGWSHLLSQYVAGLTYPGRKPPAWV